MILKLAKWIKSKKGASMLDYFILSLVSLFIGSAVMMLGGEIKKGVNLGRDRVQSINKTLSPDGK